MYKKFDNEVRFDLFRLHDSKDNVNNWILAKGQNLKIKLEDLISRTGISNTGYSVEYMWNSYYKTNKEILLGDI